MKIKNIKLGIVGLGYVGLPIAQALSKKSEVVLCAALTLTYI